MRQNGGDEAGSGLLFRADSGRKAGSISAGRIEYMVEEVLDQWYGPQMPFTKSAQMTAISISCAEKRRRRWALASGVIPATATPELIWDVDRRQLCNPSTSAQDPARSIFVRQHERHHGLAVIARPRNRFQRYEPHPLWPAPGGRVDPLV